MDIVLLLGAVLLISRTSVWARPSDTDPKTEETEMPIEPEMSIEKEMPIKEEIPFEEVPKIMFIFPTQVIHGFTVTVNGTLNISEKRLTALLPSEEENCKFVYDFETKKMQISPQVENSDLQYLEPTLVLAAETQFSLKVRARRLKGNPMFKLSLNINGVGDSKSLTCPINDFEVFSKIIFNEGIHNITSLLFEFEP